MDTTIIRDHAVKPALDLLWQIGGVRSDERAMQLLLAIGLQESGFTERQQIRGPAISYWQNEAIFVVDVLTRAKSRDVARGLCVALDVPPVAATVHQAIRYHDILAAGIARLALWLDPKPLPTAQDEAWTYYLRCWKPGKPRPEKWAACWKDAAMLTRDMPISVALPR